MKQPKQVGQFTKESDGRLSGHVLFISAPRKDGKIPVTHAFGHGPRIKKLYTPEKLQEQIELVQKENQ